MDFIEYWDEKQKLEKRKRAIEKELYYLEGKDNFSATKQVELGAATADFVDSFFNNNSERSNLHDAIMFEGKVRIGHKARLLKQELSQIPEKLINLEKQYFDFQAGRPKFFGRGRTDPFNPYPSYLHNAEVKTNIISEVEKQLLSGVTSNGNEFDNLDYLTKQIHIDKLKSDLRTELAQKRQGLMKELSGAKTPNDINRISEEIKKVDEIIDKNSSSAGSSSAGSPTGGAAGLGGGGGSSSSSMTEDQQFEGFKKDPKLSDDSLMTEDQYFESLKIDHSVSQDFYDHPDVNTDPTQRVLQKGGGVNASSTTTLEGGVTKTEMAVSSDPAATVDKKFKTPNMESIKKTLYSGVKMGANYLTGYLFSRAQDLIFGKKMSKNINKGMQYKGYYKYGSKALKPVLSAAWQSIAKTTVGQALSAAWGSVANSTIGQAVAWVGAKVAAVYGAIQTAMAAAFTAVSAAITTAVTAAASWAAGAIAALFFPW